MPSTPQAKGKRWARYRTYAIVHSNEASTQEINKSAERGELPAAAIFRYSRAALATTSIRKHTAGNETRRAVLLRVFLIFFVRTGKITYNRDQHDPIQE